MTERSAIGDPVDRLHGYLCGFHATSHVYTGIECGLFRALTDPTTPAELAAALGLHRPSAERFCEAGLRWASLATESADQRDLLAAAGLTEEARSTVADRFDTYEGVLNP